METVRLRQLSVPAWTAQPRPSPAVWLNPALVRSVVARTSGALVTFSNGDTLEVAEPLGLVVATLTTCGAVCRDCYEPLAFAWQQQCTDCREHAVDAA